MKAEKFNRSQFSRWLNSGTGRLFRIFAGAMFLIVGIVYYPSPLAIVSIIWSIFPLSAGLFDLCYISLALGGPFQGPKIRALQSESK